MTKRIIVAGGGTGGHLFPGIAVVEELRRRVGADVLFVGTQRGIESRVLPKRGERLETLEISPLKGRSTGELVRSLGRIPGAMARAASLVRKHRAELVLGVGGYAAGPVLASAAAMGTPTALLEQNARVGLTNRMLAPLVGRAYLTFDETARLFGGRSRVVGNPVRREFALAARRAAVDPVGFESRADTVLVMGGSQGAKALNEIVPNALGAMDLHGHRVVHQTGEAMRDAVEARYRELGIEAEVVSFIDDMASVYSRASVVIARAGATTLAELCAIGRPALLVPYPYAADDHQYVNAKALESKDAAICVRESDLSVHVLVEKLSDLLGDPNRRRAMAEAARGLGKPDAAASIVDDICSWLGWTPKPTVTHGGSGGAGSESDDDGKHSLRGGGYSPVLRTAAYRPRRKLVFDGAFSWSDGSA